jgi:hypothetical protein
MRESKYNIWVEKPQAAYVFNARSGALLRIDAEHYRSFRGFLSEGTSDCPPSVLANLVAGSMLVADDADEIEGSGGRVCMDRNRRRISGALPVAVGVCRYRLVTQGGRSPTGVTSRQRQRNIHAA